MKNCEKPWEHCFKYYNSGKTGGFNCSESTLLGLCEAFGVEENEMIPMIASPFGGGIGREGHICGSLVGGLMFLGINFGRKDVNHERGPAYDTATTLLNKFTEKYGSINCRDITGLDMKDEVQVAGRKEEVHETICRPLVRQVCEWVKEELENQGVVEA